MRFRLTALFLFLAGVVNAEPMLPLTGPVLPLNRLGLFQVAIIAPGGVSLSGNNTFTGANTFTGDPTIINKATFVNTPTGDNVLSNFLTVGGGGTATLPAVTTAATFGARFDIVGAGSSAQIQAGFRTSLFSGYTGSSTTLAIQGVNLSSGTGSNLDLDNTSTLVATGNIGIFGSSTASTTGLNIGTQGLAYSGNVNVGAFGRSTVDKASATNIGVLGAAANAGATPVVVGGAFLLSAADGMPTFISAVGLFDNGAVAVPLLVARDNGAALPTTGATATWQVQDGGQPQYGLGVLTNATMAAETQAYQTTVTSSYTWTNAQVAALAGTAGDITVATLPAKTQVLDAMVVITGAAVGPATVTVSCGDAIAGTPFINYTVPSDAKAAANTVYGDAVGERGTSLDAEFWYLPSYTATTLVTCHYISTVANLSTVTGSTGRVILTTRLLP